MSDLESDYLNRVLTELGYETTNQFYHLFDNWVDYINDIGNQQYSSSLSDYQNNIQYRELKGFISANPNTFYIIARDYLNGHINIFTNILLEYEFVEKDASSIQIANQIRETNNAISVNSLRENVYIVPSYETNMKTFIRSMLNVDHIN